MSLMNFTHYLFGYVGTAICSVGLSLALCSVYVFTRRQMRCAMATYLAALSASDSCILSLGLIIAINASIPPEQQSEFYYSSYIHKKLFPYIYACVIWFQFTSVWITTAFAIDRWFAIKWPMLHYTYSSKRAFYIVIMIYALGFIYSLPRFFEYKTEIRREKLIEIINETEYVEHLVIVNKFLRNEVYHLVVHLILYSLFQSILPLLLLSYFNVELIRNVQASSDFVKRFTSLNDVNVRSARERDVSRTREGSITRSVIYLIGLFTLCQVPASILHYIHMYYRHHPALYICYDISNFLILLNSAVNFFIFTYYNRKFRRELKSICCRSNLSSASFSSNSGQIQFRRPNSYINKNLINMKKFRTTKKQTLTESQSQRDLDDFRMKTSDVSRQSESSVGSRLNQITTISSWQIDRKRLTKHSDVSPENRPKRKSTESNILTDRGNSTKQRSSKTLLQFSHDDVSCRKTDEKRNELKFPTKNTFSLLTLQIKNNNNNVSCVSDGRYSSRTIDEFSRFFFHTIRRNDLPKDICSISE